MRIRLVVLLLIGACNFTTPVWLCRRPFKGEVNGEIGSSSSNPVGSNSGDSVSEYLCGGRGDSTTNVVLGVFLNTGKEAATKPLKSVQYGVEVLRPHQVNFDLLNSSLYFPWLHTRKFKLEPHLISDSATTRSVDVGPETASLVYQKRTICGYRSGGLIVNAALRVYSTIAHDKQRLKEYNPQVNASTKRAICKYAPLMMMPLCEPLETTETMRKSLRFNSPQAMTPLLAPENLVMADGRADDTLEMVQYISARLSSENVETGVHLNWASRFQQQYMVYGQEKTTTTMSIPPKKVAQFFQASAVCGDIAIRGWIIPVFLPLSAQGSYSGEYETPEFPEFCVTGHEEVGTGEASLRWRSCHDSFREINTHEDGSPIQVAHGIEGPYARTGLGSKFEQKFLEILRELGDFTTTMDVPLTRYNWARFTITDWAKYTKSNGTLKIPVPTDPEVEHTRVFQLVGQCRLYSLLTQEIVFVQLNKEKRCVRTIGIPSATCAVMQKWIDFKFK